MTAPFDIFAVETGGVNWLGSAETFEDAKARIQELSQRSPGEFVLLNHHTGKKLVIKPSGDVQSLES